MYHSVAVQKHRTGCIKFVNQPLTSNDKTKRHHVRIHGAFFYCNSDKTDPTQSVVPAPGFIQQQERYHKHQGKCTACEHTFLHIIACTLGDVSYNSRTECAAEVACHDKTPGWPEVEGHYVYSIENGEYTKISNLLSADTTYYDIENMKTNTDFSFVVTSVCKVDGKEKESTWSNIAEVTTAKKDYKVNYSVNNEDAADIKVRHLGNVEIKSGDEISESEIIKVKVTPKSELYELVSMTLDNGGETMIFTPETDGTIECAFTLNGEANIQVSTKRAVTSAQVTFTDTYTADVAVIGTVSAVAGDSTLNAPGGTVTDDVTFTAVPESGYGLKSWKITDADNNTVTIDAAGSDTYTLRLASEEYTVEAEFASLSEIGKQVKVNIPAEGGTIEITDANGDIIELNDNNSVYVPVDCELTFTVKADTDCKFRAWTGDAEGQSGESFTMTITKDTEIGAEFDVPVRLMLTYSAASGEQTGAVATKQGYQSGTGVIVGTKIVLTAQAAENYRVQKLVITRDDKVDAITTDDKLYSQYDYEIVMDTKTDIQVYFTEIEQYTVTIDSIENANMTVKNGNEDFVSGNTVRYGDEITVTVKPNENYRLADTASRIDNGDGSYTYKTGAVKANTNISVKIEKIPEYTVTFPTTIEGCILSVKNGKEKISSGDKLLEGTQLTATVTLDPTFILKGWYIGGELLSETNKNEITFTVDSDILLTVIVTDVKGDTGDTGVGVKSVVIDENGNLIITLTDDSVLDLGKVTGEKGDAGIGVKSVTVDEDGNLIITLTDDTVHNAGKVIGDKGEQGDKGDKGDKGDTGVGVKSVTIDEDGNLIITLTDDSVLDLGKVTGEKGDTGIGVKSVSIDEDGNLIITLTDNTVHNAGKVIGDKGEQGDKGDTGATGVGVKSVTIDEDGNLIITLTDDTVHNAGKVTGDKGEQGDKGDKGYIGATGVGVKSVVIDDDGNLIITLTDDTEYNLGKVTGDKGEQGDKGDNGDKGDKGDTGATGVGVKSVTIDEDGNLIITLTDDTVHNAGKVIGDKGEQGDAGATGVGVKSVTIDEDGNLIITLTDGTVHNAGKVTGSNGSNGENGASGVGVKSVMIDEDGNLIITLTDDTMYNLGKVTGVKDNKGEKGEKGTDGNNGVDGVGIANAVVDENGNLIITLSDGTVRNFGKITGNNGNNGENGASGVGVKSVTVDEDGNLIITLTDNTVHNAGKVIASNGENGKNGADGVGIENAVVDENGNLIITLSDGTAHNLGRVTGEKGDAGKDGQDGSNGNGIQSADIDADGNLIITFTDGVVTNLGKIVGTDGKNGTDGKDGKGGVDGKNGIGIKGCRIDDNGNLILTLTDNTTLDAGNISAISDNVNVSKPLATAAVSVAGTSLLWNVVSVAISIIRKKKLV